MNTNLMYIDGDGQAQNNDASQGIPFGVQTVNAPAGSDAAAILALAIPGQSTAKSSTPIDLEFVLPPGFAVAGDDGSACSNSSSTPNHLLLILGALAILWMVR